jgi:SP family arabinose:H+ symporter-like MFS transporter
MTTPAEPKHPGIYSMVISLIVAIGGFLLGFDATVISGATPFYKRVFELPEGSFLIGFSVSAIIFGCVAGNLSAGALADRFGRKRILLATALLFGFCAAGCALAHGVTFFVVARIIGGLGVGLAILVAPMYIAEIAPAKQRGFLVTFNQLNIVVGISVAYFSNYFILKLVEDPATNWRYMLGVGTIPAVAYLLLLLIVPESPRWLVQQGRDHEALAIMRRVGGEEHTAREYQQIKENLATHNESEGAALSELFSKRMRFVLFIGLVIAFFQQVSGINAILYYAPMIFEMAGGGKADAFIQAAILGLVNLLMTIVSMFLIDRLGRKPLLVIGSLMMAASLLAASFAFYRAHYSLGSEAIARATAAVVDDAIRDEAKRQHPTSYKADTVVKDGGVARLLAKGEVIASVPMDSPAVLRAQSEAAFMSSVLSRMADQVYSQETVFFGQIKAETAKAVRQEVDAVLTRGDQSVADYEIISKRATALTASANGSAEAVALEITELKYSAYKDRLLRNSITINARIVLGALLGFIAGFAISLGPVMWALLSEIFPNRLRGLAISVAGTWNAITSFVVATVFPMQLERMGSSATYLIYGLFMVACLLFVLKWIPETKGKTLEQIERDLVGA